MDHLNYFYPYTNAKPSDENSLTRAFLATMKFVPFVQNMFIELVREQMIKKNIDQLVPSLIEEYLHFWSSDKVELKQIKKDKQEEYQDFIRILVDHRLMQQKDLIKLKEQFDETKRPTLNVCPGIEFIYKWTKEDAIDLDRKGFLVNTIAQKIDEALHSWGDTIEHYYEKQHV